MSPLEKGKNQRWINRRADKPNCCGEQKNCSIFATNYYLLVLFSSQFLSQLFNKLRGDCRLPRTSGSPQKLDRVPLRWSSSELRDRLLYAADIMASLEEFCGNTSFLAEEALSSGFELQ